MRTANCASLWLDGEIMNTRVTQNLFAEAANPVFGHIFLEINYRPNLIDNKYYSTAAGTDFMNMTRNGFSSSQNLIANGDAQQC